MKKWVCSVCGYVHEGDAAPEKCPVCKVPASKFKEMQADAKLAAEQKPWRTKPHKKAKWKKK